MNKLLAVSLFTFAFSLCSAFGAANDTLISFSTPGPDKYADGTTVKDGECYALVWTKAGATFAGIAADGTAVGNDSKVLVFAPLAKGGRCPTVVFELDAALAEQYAGGSYAVYLVDTRLANGSLGGVSANGLPVAVNGYGACVDAESVDAASLPRATDGFISDSTRQAAASTVSVTTKSALPANTPKPQITAIRVVGDKVFLTVKNTLPCLQYKAVDAFVSNAADKDGSSSQNAIGTIASTGEATQGAAAPDAEITIIAPKKGESGFYSVGRE